MRSVRFSAVSWAPVQDVFGTGRPPREHTTPRSTRAAFLRRAAPVAAYPETPDTSRPTWAAARLVALCRVGSGHNPGRACARKSPGNGRHRGRGRGGNRGPTLDSPGRAADGLKPREASVQRRTNSRELAVRRRPLNGVRNQRGRCLLHQHPPARTLTGHTHAGIQSCTRAGAYFARGRGLGRASLLGDAETRPHFQLRESA